MKMRIDNATYKSIIPQPILDIFSYAIKEGEIYYEADLIWHFAEVLGFDFDRGITISVAKNSSIDLIDDKDDNTIYPTTPFEFFPFGWQGGDALQYGHLILAPELDQVDFPIVSFSPSDDYGLAWLGNDTPEGIKNLLTASLKRIPRNNIDAMDSFVNSKVYKFICSKFAINPNRNNRIITKGARSDIRTNITIIPEGWTFKKDAMGGGVLAKQETFNPVLETVPYSDSWTEQYLFGLEQMKLGYYGSALFIFRNIFADSFNVEKHIELAKSMKEVYLKLDKTLLANKVDLSLESWIE